MDAKSKGRGEGIEEFLACTGAQKEREEREKRNEKVSSRPREHTTTH